jgi:hypothetical protein
MTGARVVNRKVRVRRTDREQETLEEFRPTTFDELITRLKWCILQVPW